MLVGSFLMGFLGTDRWIVSQGRVLGRAGVLTATGDFEGRHLGVLIVDKVYIASARGFYPKIGKFEVVTRCQSVAFMLNKNAISVDFFSSEVENAGT